MKKRSKYLHIILILVLGVAVYAHSRLGAFVWDDDSVLTASRAPGPDRSLSALTYKVDRFFWKTNPQGYHWTNIFLHIAVVLVLYAFVSLLFGNGSLALGTAALFMVHPVHTEVVAHIAGRDNSIALLLMLLCFICYVKRLRYAPVKNSGVSKGLYVGMVLIYALALFSRDNVLILPVLLLFYHYVFNKKIKWLDFISIAGLAGLFLILGATLTKPLFPKIPSAQAMTDRLPGIFVAVTNYARLLFLPLNLHADYGHPYFFFRDPKALLGLLIVLSAAGYGWRKRRTDPLVSFGIGWFILTLVTAWSIFPSSFYMAESWLYIPSIGFFLIVSQKILALSRVKNFKIYAYMILAGLLCFYSLLTIQQSEYWRDPVTFYKRTLQFSPDTAALNNHLGKVYEERGLLGNAVKAYQNAIMAEPRYAESYNNLGFLCDRLGKREDAILLYREAIRINPRYPDSYNNLAVIYSALGKKKEAFAFCNKALQLNPDYVAAYDNLGRINIDLERYPEAIKAFQKALELNPVYTKATDGIGFAYRNEGQYDEAIAFFKRAIKLNPRYVSAYYNLSSVYRDKKQYPEAIKVLEKAFEIEPENIDVLNALASLQKASGHASKAYVLYQKALVMDPGNPILYFNLGNVSLALERRHEAIDLYKKALQINPEFGEAYDNLAVIYLREGQYQLAIENADKAVRNGVANPELLETLKPYRNK